MESPYSWGPVEHAISDGLSEPETSTGEKDFERVFGVLYQRGLIDPSLDKVEDVLNLICTVIYRDEERRANHPMMCGPSVQAQIGSELRRAGYIK